MWVGGWQTQIVEREWQILTLPSTSLFSPFHGISIKILQLWTISGIFVVGSNTSPLLFDLKTNTACNGSNSQSKDDITGESSEVRDAT